MSKRAPRIVIGLGLGAAAIVLCLVVFDSEALAVHAAMWRTRLSGGTVVWPGPATPRGGTLEILEENDALVLLQFISDSSGDPMAIEAADCELLSSKIPWEGGEWRADLDSVRELLIRHGIAVSREKASGSWRARTFARNEVIWSCWGG
jgi:hypothetical protein